MVNLAEQVGAALQQHRLLLVTAESCTGGGIAAAITDIAGSSAWFECGFVTYSNRAKQQLLGVPEALLAQHGAVSEAVVAAMTAGALANSGAQLAVAVSGIAGPGGGSPVKPVGSVWFAWQQQERSVRCRSFQFNGDRQQVRRQAVVQGLQGILDYLQQP